MRSFFKGPEIPFDQDSLLNLFKKKMHPLTEWDLRCHFRVKTPQSKEQLRSLLTKLVEKGDLHKQSSQNYCLSLVPEMKGKSYPSFAAVVFQRKARKGRKTEEISLWLTACKGKGREIYHVLEDKACEGDVVLAQEVQDPRQPFKKSAAILKVLGKDTDPEVVKPLIVHTHHLPEDFPSDVMEEAEKYAAQDFSQGTHEDLTSIDFVTIDGQNAKDFDDAIWAEAWIDPCTLENKGWHIMVAIADVSFYIPWGSALDQEALKRGCSVYLPHMVIPMLPEILSNGVCSLVPGEKRACLAVHLWIDSTGSLKNHQFIRGVIQSRNRLTYDQVQEALSGNLQEDFLQKILSPLYEAFKALKRNRNERGTLDLDFPDYRIYFDGISDTPQSIQLEKRWESHQLVEELMILANVAAAKTLTEHQAPCLYRVHDMPVEEKIVALRKVLTGLGIGFPKKRQSESFQHLLKTSENSPHQALIHHMVLRSQMQACYSPLNKGHFGLNLPLYTHFTSPIRRYPDLMVHRSLIHTLNLGHETIEANIDWQYLGECTSKREREAVKAERDAFQLFSAFYLKNFKKKKFGGIITGVISAGFFVTLTDNGLEGFLPLSYMPEDTYIYDPHKYCFLGKKTKKTYTLGDKINVMLKEVNPLLNLIRFSFKK